MSPELWATLIGLVFSIGVTIGVTKTISSRQDREIDGLKDDYTALVEKLTKLKDEMRQSFVTSEHFSDSVAQLREMQRDMRDDIKKILEYISTEKYRT